MFVQDNAFRGYSDLSRLKAVIVSIQSRHIIQFEFILETTCTVPVPFTFTLEDIEIFLYFYKSIMFSINSHA